METPGHFSPIAWATVQKPVAIATEEKSSRLNSKITNASENLDSKGTEQARKKGESEKPSDNIGEEEEEGGLCQYERVSSDKDGKLCSDISVDRLGIEKNIILMTAFSKFYGSGLGSLERQNAYAEEEDEEETEVENVFVAIFRSTILGGEQHRL